MGKNCLVGCIADNYCEPINEPPDMDSQSPFVKVKFTTNDFEVTVGNESSPSTGNTMCITSFEFGGSNGFESTIEIIDERGGAFSKIVDNLVKCASKGSNASIFAEAEWGWIRIECNNQTPKITKSPPVKMIIYNLQTSVTEGKFKYNIHCRSVLSLYMTQKEKIPWGDDDKPMHLEDAIKKLCDIEPKLKVKYGKRDKSCNFKEESLLWQNFGEKGPKCKWQPDGQNRLSVIAKWIEPFHLKAGVGGKGVMFTTDNRSDPNTIIIWEDPEPNPGESKGLCHNFCHGTFIVNGGKCSNVIEFSPTINWPAGFFSFASGGETGGAGKASTETKKDAKPEESEKKHGDDVGMEEGITITHPAWDCHGPKNATKETNKSQNKHHKANRVWAHHSVIRGDLTIVGDPRPRFVRQVEWIKSFCAVVVLNPFHIAPTRGLDADCGNWLAAAQCNDVLTNNNWRITKVNHSIKGGTYTTTLSLELPASGIDLASNDPIGGPGSKYKPKNLCD